MIRWWHISKLVLYSPKKRNVRCRRMKRIFFILIFLSAIGLLLYFCTPKDLFPQPPSALLYSAEKELLGARIAADGQWRFPATDTVSDKFTACITTYEDKRFFYHPGIDPLALARAVLLNIEHRQIVSGGSTLTMQVARMARGNRSRNLYEKAVEALWALSLECRLSKQEILSLYANHAPFGGNVIGLETAAWRYFGRDASRLSWAENATLAVLPNAPALIHPGKNRDLLLQKRNRLLAELQKRGIIDETTYELSCLEPLPQTPLPLPNHAPHLLDRMMKESGTGKMQSTLQYRLQIRCQQIVNQYADKYKGNHVHNIGALIADIETGEVLAYVGNITNDTSQISAWQVDLVTSERSTGSILKPFLYAGMLHDGLLLPGTLIPDIPLNINGFTPQNFNKTFYGAVPAHTAIERSLNVPLVRMLSQYNTSRFLALLKKTGMTTLPFSADHYGASLILGGAEGSLWDITGMYASLSRTLNHFKKYNGRYCPADIHPLRFTPSPPQKPIQSVKDERLTDETLYSAVSIWHTFEAMSALSRPEEEADWQQFESMKKVAWKTGTSYGNRDAWAVGVTSRYAVGVWVGNATGEGRPQLTGVGYAAPVLFDLFSLLPASPWFEEPLDESAETVICRKSGYRASDACDETDTIRIPESGLQTKTCPFHRFIHLSLDEKFRVNSSCERIERMIKKSWFVLPPAQEYYYKNYHIDYRPLPPIKPGCDETQSSQIAIIYPEYNAILILPKGFEGEKNPVVFKAAHAREDATLYWHLDDIYLGETSGKHEIACRPDIGTHLLTVIDEQGNQRKIIFNVK